MTEYREKDSQPRIADMMLNMGPQHPATHGVFRMVLAIDGERVIDVTPHIGCICTGAPKSCVRTKVMGRLLPFSIALTTSAISTTN